MSVLKLNCELIRYGRGVLLELSESGLCNYSECMRHLGWCVEGEVSSEEVVEERKTRMEGCGGGGEDEEGVTEVEVVENGDKEVEVVENGEKEVMTAEIPVEVIEIKKNNVVLPFCAIVYGCCEAIRKNHNLYTQCGKRVTNGEKLCKGCLKQASNSPTGKPPYGMIEDRAGMGPNYIDPRGGKAVPYANVMKRLGISISEASTAAAEYGWTIPESELVERVSRRGRPKKVKTAAAAEDEKPKKRGRPAKAKEKEKTQEDYIAQLAKQLQDEGEDELKEEVVEECTDKYKDGDLITMAANFIGTVTRINGVQYLITKGLPGDDDGEEYVWTAESDEVEMIGTYEDGKIIEVEEDEE